jgi:hypothetical protein
LYGSIICQTRKNRNLKNSDNKDIWYIFYCDEIITKNKKDIYSEEDDYKNKEYITKKEAHTRKLRGNTLSKISYIPQISKNKHKKTD